MVKILIPRSNSISAKTIVPTDFEKYFNNIIKDHIVTGFTVTATTGVNRSVDVSTGSARIKGMFVNNDALETTAHTFGTDNTHYLYIQLTRDAYSEPESWSYTSNTTGTPPTDSIVLAKVITAAGDVSSIDQTYEFKKMSHLHGFVGTGDEIIALTSPYAGMIVSCTKNGDVFLANNQYVRNATNTTWTRITTTGNYYFGGGADGDLTVSSGTTTLTETKYYNNVTVAVGATLTANNPMMLFANGTVTVNGTINMDGKGSAAGVDGTLGISGGNGGAGQGNGGSGGSGGAGNGAGQNTGLTGGGTAPGVGTGATGSFNRLFYNPFDWISTTPRPSGIGAGGGAGGGSGSGGNGGKGGGGPSYPNGGGPGGTG